MLTPPWWSTVELFPTSGVKERTAAVDGNRSFGWVQQRSKAVQSSAFLSLWVYYNRTNKIRTIWLLLFIQISVFLQYTIDNLMAAKASVGEWSTLSVPMVSQSLQRKCIKAWNSFVKSYILPGEDSTSNAHRDRRRRPPLHIPGAHPTPQSECAYRWFWYFQEAYSISDKHKQKNIYCTI